MDAGSHTHYSTHSRPCSRTTCVPGHQAPPHLGITSVTVATRSPQQSHLEYQCPALLLLSVLTLDKVPDPTHELGETTSPGGGGVGSIHRPSAAPRWDDRHRRCHAKQLCHRGGGVILGCGCTVRCGERREASAGWRAAWRAERGGQPGRGHWSSPSWRSPGCALWDLQVRHVPDTNPSV